MDYSQENNQNHTNLPASITVNVEVIPHKQETVIISTEEARNMLNLEQIKGKDKYLEPAEIIVDPLECDGRSDATLLSLPIEPEVSTGVHFLTDEDSSKSEENYERKKYEFLEYMPQGDGSVVCKRCGEVLASRTHWYRHKYKFHVTSFGNPSPLFKCDLCNVFFKSRKGYMGHYATRHTESKINEITESIQVFSTTKEELPEEVIMETPPAVISNTGVVKKRFTDKTGNWEEQRMKEEKLVADIINRVKRECEAQGAVVTRKGYSRRTTSVMNSQAF
ncbi:unnamed protein product [Ceutorhynchus assimilis]|uniref:C2H2-type domain-containing protein n=1 Tax=Ceutorhynchus assimilis TaxID=467358 RepID=A0A9N9MQ06_9CUCU|nr:unnamed protein product [Ceutorhynchus assimilis]